MDLQYLQGLPALSILYFRRDHFSSRSVLPPHPALTLLMLDLEKRDIPEKVKDSL